MVDVFKKMFTSEETLHQKYHIYRKVSIFKYVQIVTPRGIMECKEGVQISALE